jgi:fermentation-respiration switch protein FrsA (DUF1100 family)
MFPNINRMENIDCPLLVIHGTRDEIIPAQHGQELFDICKNKNKQIFLVKSAGHNNIEQIAGQ